jgi:hypothetical protein
MVSDESTSLAHWLGPSHYGVFGSLQFKLSIYLGPEQYNVKRYVKPKQQNASLYREHVVEIDEDRRRGFIGTRVLPGK